MISIDWQNQIFEKKNGDPDLPPMGLKQSQSDVFCYFLKFGSYVSLEILCDDSLRQYLTSSEGGIHKKILGPPFSLNLGQRLGFLPFCQVWFINFP